MIPAQSSFAANPALRPLWIAFGVNFLWINLSEVFRYFAFVMPMMRDALQAVPGVAPMDLPVFTVWGLWDTMLVVSATAIPWLVMEKFGASVRAALAAGTLVWATVFGLFWLALFNMNLAPAAILAIALPLAWLELAAAALIVRWSVLRYG